MYYIQPLDRRITSILIGLLVALSIIACRLFYLQILHADYYLSRGEKNFTRVELIPPHRGNMYDCKGNLLATNRPITNLMWNGTGSRKLSDEQQALLTQISSLMHFEITDALLQSVLAAERTYKRAMIACDVPLQQLSKITERYPDNPNIHISTHFQRYYPHGSYASHIVGYLSRHTDGSTSSSGQMGLEKMFDQLLKGEEGAIIKTVNSRGRDIAAARQYDSHSGEDIHTTLDLDLQRIAESVYPQDLAGCILIMDPEDGAIRALVSRPSFDPSMFLKPISYETWAEMQKKKPFLNRAITPYPLGSIFKLVTISAALEQGLLHPDQRWDCQGYVSFAGRKYWCNRRWGHGELTTPHAFAQSCNVLFFELGKLMDIDMLADYAHRFGLGYSTNFTFADHAGIVPSRDWKMITKGERWWPGETLSVAIGQSFLMATPMQIARMVGAIFTGYLVKPRIVEAEPIQQAPLNIKPITQVFLQRCMRLVVTKGLGKKVDGIPGMKLYAKTSTAQIADLAKRKVSDDYLEHAWFVTFAQYKNEKPLVVLVLAENAGTSQVASSIAKELALKLRSHWSALRKQK